MRITQAIPSLAPSDSPWGRALRRGFFAYVISRLFVVMGAAIAVAAEAVTARNNDEEPIAGLNGLAQVFASWDGHWYLDVVREGYPHHIMPNVTVVYSFTSLVDWLVFCLTTAQLKRP
jgi:hypothetical protein